MHPLSSLILYLSFLPFSLSPALSFSPTAFCYMKIHRLDLCCSGVTLKASLIHWALFYIFLFPPLMSPPSLLSRFFCVFSSSFSTTKPPFYQFIHHPSLRLSALLLFHSFFSLSAFIPLYAIITKPVCVFPPSVQKWEAPTTCVWTAYNLPRSSSASLLCFSGEIQLRIVRIYRQTHAHTKRYSDSGI